MDEAPPSRRAKPKGAVDRRRQRVAGKDWYLRDWMSELKRKQAWIARDLGWERGRVSKLYNGKQDYTRADVVQLADWLKIEPFELLMPPREALAYRRIRATAALIVAEADALEAEATSDALEHVNSR